MNEVFYIIWGAAIFCVLVDFYFRWRFNIGYLKLSIPVIPEHSIEPKNLTSIVPDKIYHKDYAKYFLPSNSNKIWVQSTFKNNRSTLGLIKVFTLNESRQTLTKEQVRLSIGIIPIIALVTYMFYLQGERFAGFGGGLEWLPYMPLIMLGVTLINYVFAFRRLQADSREVLQDLSQNEPK